MVTLFIILWSCLPKTSDLNSTQLENPGLGKVEMTTQLENSGLDTSISTDHLTKNNVLTEELNIEWEAKGEGMQKQASDRKDTEIQVISGLKATEEMVKLINQTKSNDRIPENEDRIGNLTFDHMHTLWNALLKEYVSSDGKVNYKSLKKEESRLDQYLADIKAQSPNSSQWSSKQKIAFWINAYNAFTVKKILEKYPVSSILNIDNGKVWDKKWIDIGNEKYSLNQIEHEILRPVYKDPRIHFALNCAARSCPPLWNEAWTAQNLESSLESRTKLFLNNAKFNRITKRGIQLSKIFEWYAEDFGNIYDFLQKYSTSTVNNNVPISFMKYDWRLNKI